MVWFPRAEVYIYCGTSLVLGTIPYHTGQARPGC